MSDYLRVWLDQLNQEGDENGAALAESLIRERERSESWKQAVISSGAAYEAMRRMVSSYQDQIRSLEVRLLKVTDAPETFRNIFQALSIARKMVTSKDRDEIKSLMIDFLSEIAKIDSDDVQSTIMKQFTFEYEQAQLELPIDG